LAGHSPCALVAGTHLRWRPIDGFFGIFFGKDGVTIGNQAFDLGMTKKYKWAGDGAIGVSTNLPALR
jgi:hypothetical protein